MSDLSSRLRDLRVKKSLTQKALADYLEIYEKSYQRYEHGERKLYNDVLIKLADYFNVSVDYLLGLTDNPERNL